MVMVNLRWNDFIPKTVGKMRRVSRGAVLHSWSSDGREFEKRSPCAEERGLWGRVESG